MVTISSDKNNYIKMSFSYTLKYGNVLRVKKIASTVPINLLSCVCVCVVVSVNVERKKKNLKKI